MAIVNNTALCTGKLLRDLKCSHHIQRNVLLAGEYVDDLILVIIPQCICTTSHQVVHFKYIQLYLWILPQDIGKIKVILFAIAFKSINKLKKKFNHGSKIYSTEYFNHCWKEIKETKKGKKKHAMFMNWNTQHVKRFILLKVVYRIKASSVKISAQTSSEIDKPTLKFRNLKGPWIPKNHIEKEEKRRNHLFWLKPFYKPIVIKPVWCWHTEKHIDP